MALTPTDWSKRVELTGLTPASSLTGLTTVITEANIPADVWAVAINGGGDLRVCADSGGVNQLPLEVVGFDTVGETAVLWTRFATYSTGARSLWLFYGKAGETQPAVGASFGRNAVWSGETHRQGGDGATDVTGASTITISNATQTGSIKGFNSVSFPNQGNTTDSATARASFDGTTGENWTGDFTVSAWVNASSLSIDFAQIIGTRTSSQWEFSLRLEGSQPAILIGTSSPNSTGNLTVSTDHLIHATVSGTTISFFLDGVAIGTASVSGGRVNRNKLLCFGGADDTSSSGTTFAGLIANARAINGSVLSANHIASEYDNQNAPNTFWTTGTPESTSGSVLTIVPTSIASGEVVGSPTVILGTPSNATIAPTSIVSVEVVGSPTVILGTPPNVTISPTSIASAEVVGNPVVLGGDSLSIPSASRVTWNAIASYLRTQSYVGSDNDVIKQWLSDEGLEGNYNDSWNLYLISKGFTTGSLSDKYAEWKDS
jgi:hypothetical protein